jgi:heme oxygenase
MACPHNIDIHAQLKAKTKQAHTDVDTSALLKCLMGRELTLYDYIAALLKLESWYSVYDEYLSATFSGVNAIAHIHPKSKLIKTDLVNLGAIPMPPPADDLAKMLQLDFHYSLGALYVIEGSTMGGIVLAPRLEKHFMRTDVTHFSASKAMDTK